MLRHSLTAIDGIEDFSITDNKALKPQSVSADKFKENMSLILPILKISEDADKEKTIWQERYDNGEVEETEYLTRMQFFEVRKIRNEKTIHRITKDFDRFIELWLTGKFSVFIEGGNFEDLKGTITAASHEVKAKVTLPGEGYDHLFIFSMARLTADNLKGPWKIYKIEDLYAKD